MTVLRQAAPEVGPPTHEALRAGRVRLAETARGGWRAKVLRRPVRGGWRPVGAGAVALALGVAAALTVLQALTPGGTASAAAAEVLRNAAAAARAEAPAAPGKFLYTKTLTVHITLQTGDTNHTCSESWFLPDGTPWAMRTGADRNDDRCRTSDGPSLNGPSSKRPDGDGRPRADARALPTDPAALRERLYDDAEHGRADIPERRNAPHDFLVFDRIGRLLRMPVPPALRAALYETLITVPGVDVRQDVPDALGRRGTALVRTEADGWLGLILAPRTYHYLGSRAESSFDESKGVTDVYATALLASAPVDGKFRRP
ncbi:CU044_5270 family protein [Spirillospora sp. NPDC050679]